MRDEIIVSVCDHSGRWSQPYVDLGYRVLRLDPKHGPNVDQLGRGITEKVGKNGKVYRGSWLWANLGGKSERTKELRSQTPTGMSRAFAKANP